MTLVCPSPCQTMRALTESNDESLYTIANVMDSWEMSKMVEGGCLTTRSKFLGMHPCRYLAQASFLYLPFLCFLYCHGLNSTLLPQALATIKA